jgi:hypothetical protein
MQIRKLLLRINRTVIITWQSFKIKIICKQSNLKRNSTSQNYPDFFYDIDTILSLNYTYKIQQIGKIKIIQYF